MTARPTLMRSMGLLEATALNMSNMVGIGPFITIPLIIASMGGPQCMLGWVLGAVLALCDGLVWSELAAAMPGTGGTYLYLREAFRKTAFGGILPFLFIWQFIFSGPLEIASGFIGFSQYVSYFWRGMGPWATRMVSLAVGTLTIALLYRRITHVGRLTVVLWIGMLVTVFWIVVSGLSNFHPKVVFDFPAGAFTFSTGFFTGLGSAMLIAMYDYLGYYDICYVGGEVRNPERVIPRSIIYSVIAVAAIYALTNLSLIAVVPWREAMNSKFIASEFIEKLYGTRTASVVTILILWTALASVFALLLGYSRIPYAAAVNGHFFKVFARLHPTGRFPHVSLLVMGALSIVASMWTLDAVISTLMTSRILIQFIGQIVALDYLRRHRPDVLRPFRMWLYPIPSAIALIGWIYVFVTSGWKYAGYGLLTLAVGVLVYKLSARRLGTVAALLVVSMGLMRAAQPVFKIEVSKAFTITDGLPSNDVAAVAIVNAQVCAKTTRGIACVSDGKWVPADAAVEIPRLSVTDAQGRVWSARPGAVESREGKHVKIYTPADGLPYDDFTSVAAADGVVWFGTHFGAIRFDGVTWEYREGRRWLPDDDIRAVAVEPNGNAWFATAKGVGLIERRSITLQEKAKFFEDEIDLRHRRTPYGYVLGVTLKRPGDKSQWTQHDSDNDGLWTSMYGAGECFAYAATGNELAKKRAKAAFEAMWFLRVVTQGGPHPAPPGFVARSILPTTGPDPNRSDGRERDLQHQKEDALWKVMSPRWPLSGDGKWYWKSDTSSDELDGHFFFYGLYYDLVASTEDEKQRVREQVSAIADHLVDHNYQLVDYDGKPTRWGVFNPENLNHSSNWWSERSLNSLSILAYLKVAEHVTGNSRYRQAARTLIEQHAYDANVLIPKTNAGPGSGNQSDDEMAFMDFYNLIRYETDPDLQQKYALAFSRYWAMERPELNPLFNFMYAGVNTGKTFSDAWGKRDLSPKGPWLAESIDTLERYPLDRVNWRIRNSHRKDLRPVPAYANEEGEKGRGFRNNGKVLPIDERFVDQWNHDPWQLDQGGDGRQLADGGSFLLPYYLGLYHKFIEK